MSLPFLSFGFSILSPLFFRSWIAFALVVIVGWVGGVYIFFFLPSFFLYLILLPHLRNTFFFSTAWESESGFGVGRGGGINLI